MALSGSQKAYRWARSGIARSGATRSNYVFANVSIDWIVRDDAGGIISTVNLSDVILMGSLRVTQALNDEADTCSFTIGPQATPAQIPAVGDGIRIAWAAGPAAGVTLFDGYVLVSQADWRLGNLQRQWTAVQCQDPLWRFDARIVNYRFPAQSVTASIAFLVAYFCNMTPAGGGALDFSLAFVQADMPAIAAFDVVNQRPSTVMRTLLAAVGGAFYLEGLTLHAWAGSLTEPGQTNPQPLTVDLATLKAVRVTTDATQVRRRVLVEGRRTTTMIPLPATTAAGHTETYVGAALDDATLFEPGGATQLMRIGTQWLYGSGPSVTRTAGANPPQTRTAQAFAKGDLFLHLQPMAIVPPTFGWIRVGNQYTMYAGYSGTPATGPWYLQVAEPSFEYGVLTAPVPVGETVEWVDSVVHLYPHGLGWEGAVPPAATPGDPTLRAHAVSTPVVTLAVAALAAGKWPALEGFVQDGRYSYAGAAARAAEDLDTFKDPLVSVEWETEDANALPGRSQVVALSSPAFTPAVNLTITITRVDLTFPLRTLPARRSCVGGVVKPSTFLDLVVTSDA